VNYQLAKDRFCLCVDGDELSHNGWWWNTYYVHISIVSTTITTETCVFVMVNEARRYLASCTLLLYALCAEQSITETPRSAEMHCPHYQRLSPLQNVQAFQLHEIEFLQALFCRLSENKRDRRTNAVTRCWLGRSSIHPPSSFLGWDYKASRQNANWSETRHPRTAFYGIYVTGYLGQVSP
jgi:hypothetical protein